MNQVNAIEVKHVSKYYRLYNNQGERILELLTRKPYYKTFKALDNVNISIKKGEIVGIIGKNGSGKSTLSKLIAGLGEVTSGEINVRGKASMIAINSGLNPRLTGLENIIYKMTLLGFSRKKISHLIPKVIEFSELGEFIKQPVKTYSSGMRSRLGFAISINMDPDVLIIDEALSVGDQEFAEKSFQEMMRFKEKNKTILFISHSLPQIREFCTKALWIDEGKVRAYGDSESVTRDYYEHKKKS
ncbi:ABC transporter ATP-binding protein [Haloplasma contractile]|uniref:Teichoic acids export ATP-binding protein TagH n=1 Tax=Haloplasma contractile SSD-17B TaxID=1033810 RepID=F7Q1J7_9MOLU|nr:ABC transporter ATP-binding protein [Haloplasma contractile]ERJ12928.1 Teichoic acids export ATP-binding protein TagH [Haloplasma contractile SSD-17B]